MSIRIVCPSCDKAYNLDDSTHGKTVLCRECKRPFAVSVPPRPPRREDDRRSRDERIAPPPRTASSEGRYRRDDDEPRRRPVERSGERDREREDEPRRDWRPERPRREEAGNKNLVPILVGVGGAAVVLIALGIGTLVFAFRSPNSKSIQAAASASEAAPAPFAGQPAGGGEPAPAVPAGPVPSEMAASVVQQVKRSTVQLRVRFSGGGAEGSGFFAVERGIVITNAHVLGMLRAGTAAPRNVEIVINSGEAGEVRTTGTVLGVDRENDLAVLRVDGDPSRLPPPLPIDSATKLTETQKVYIFGFPLGSALGKNITVSTSSVSSLRRTNGILKQVQVNGGMHPGNSGGPVTDARGAVVGVSVAGITGTTINFAIPADFIQQVVNRAKANPLDPSAPGTGPMAGGFDPPGGTPPRPPAGPGWPGGPGRPMGPGRPAGPARGSTLQADLTALRGNWLSGDVNSEEGGTTGAIRLSISPRRGAVGGRMQVDIVSKQGGKENTSRSSYNVTLRQEGSNRLIATTALSGTRGVVFIYTFDGDDLVLSGKVLARRIVYSLSSVSLRRTSATPDDVAADDAAKGGEKAPSGARALPRGRSSPDGLRFGGDVYSFVQTAVRDNRLADVDVRGYTRGKGDPDRYREVSREGGVLIGLEVGLGEFVGSVVVDSWRPIFRTSEGEQFGRWVGKIPTKPITVKARDGYVVSGMKIRTRLGVDGFRLTFAKLDTDRLDLTDTYESDHVGGEAGTLSTVGGKGALYVGVTGYLSLDQPGKPPCALGLVAVLPKR